MPLSLRYVVSGRVQGVGFRYFTLSVARRAGLTGRVRNLPDGTVEVRAHGSQRAHERLRDALATGPAAAHVEQVDTTVADDEPSDDFHIAD